MSTALTDDAHSATETATTARPVDLSATFWVLLALIGLLTFGVFAVVFYVYGRSKYPAVIDEQGVANRAGRSFAWDDLTDANYSTMKVNGVDTGTGLVLHFGSSSIVVKPAVLKNGAFWMKRAHDYVVTLRPDVLAP